MIKSLKIKFTVTITVIILILIFFILLSINLIMHQSIETKIMNSMKHIALNDGIVNYKGFRPIEEIPVNDYNFSVLLDKNNNLIQIIAPLEFEYIEQDTVQVIMYALNTEKRDGKKYNISFLKQDRQYGTVIVFLDRTRYNQIKLNLIYVSILVFLISLIIIFFMSYFITELMLQPVKETFERQKQFIANSSHELKTPLTIVSANLDILSYEDDLEEQKKWVYNTKDEIFKMNELINNLLLLAKSENYKSNKDKIKINLSECVLNSVLSYESLCFEKRIILKYNIEDNIYLKFYEEDLNSMVRIFLDNAIKYSNVNGIIEVNLKNNFGKINLSIFNTGLGIQEKDIKNIFDRFYRVEESRNKEVAGYGLGLAIAKNILDSNNWKINTEGVYTKWIKFSIELS